MYGRSLVTSSSQAGGRGRHLSRRWVGVLTAVLVWSQIAPTLIPTAVAADEAPVTLLIQLEPGLTESEQAAVIADQGAVEAAVIAPLELHEVVVDAADAEAALAGFAADDSVVSASLDLSRQAAGSASDPDYSGQWALPLIGWEDVHDVATFSDDVTLAVLDTGVDASAPDLTGRVGAGWSFDSSDPATDANGHGTHTATIAAASADDGVGIAGVAYSNTTVMPVKVLDDTGTGSDSDVIAGLVWAADNGADVVVMPFSNPGYSEALQIAVDYVWASGAVLVAAAGNDGSTTPTYPAGDANVVGVGATVQDDAPWEASNKSDAVFLHAPGVDVLASDVTGTVSVTGTSASAALTAGAAAALRSIDPTASNATIVGRLARNADPLNDYSLGNGRLNVGRASIDTATDGVTPAGAPGGGPFVGPYIVATARTWTGVGSTNYNNGGNWTPSGTPTALDALTIPGGVASGRYPFLNAGTGGGLAASIVVGSGGSLQVTGVPLTVSGLLTNNAGGSLVISGGGTISVLNNLQNDGTLALSGASTITIPHDYLGSGTATMSLGTITVGRNWRPAGGSFTATGGKVEFTGLGDINANFAAATSQFYDVVVDAGADPRFAQAAGSSIKISHDFTNASTVLTMSANATFTFNGSVTQNVSSAETGATFGNLVVDKPAGTVNLVTNALVSGNATVTSGTLSLGAFGLDRVTAGGTISVADGAFLRIGGTGGFPANYTTRSLAPASSVSYDGSAQTVSALTYGHLTLDTGGVKTMPGTAFTVAGDYAVRMSVAATAASNITVDGDVSFGPSTNYNAGSFTHRVRGNFTNQSVTFNAGTSTFVLDGSSPQTIGGIAVTTFNNLTIDNASGVLLAMDVLIGGGGAQGLVFTNGNIMTGASTVIIKATGAVNRTSGHVVGKLRKQISTNGTVLRTYEVGTATSYAPVTLTINGVTGAGAGGFQFLTVNANAGDHPNLAVSGIDSGQSTNLYWTVATSGTWSFTTYDATFGFTPADVDAGADTSVFIVRRYNGGSWFAQAAGTRTPTSTESVGNTTFSDFAVGEPSGDATTTSLSCPASVAYGLSGSCLATVTTSIPGVAPSGTVAFTTDGSGSFTPLSSCTLVPLTTSSSTCSVTYTPTAVGTGTHQIGAFSDGVAYTSSAASPADITVTPASLTITADDQSKVYGSADPTFTFTYSGLAGGDTATATPPTCTVVGPHSSVAGSPYPITCSGAVDSNYSISYVAGDLLVTAASLTITADDQSKVYGSFDPVFTFTYSGLTGGDTATATPPTCSVVGAHSSVAGSPYPITCSGAVDSNYSITYVAGSLAVTAAPLTITANNQTKTAGGSDPVFTFTYTGLTNGDVATATPPTCTVVPPHATVGTYPITCSGAVDSNYSITYVAGTLTVTTGFTFTGFFQPVDNLPTLNTLKAGQAVPVKFSLGGNQGLSIFAAGYPKTEVITCGSTALLDGIEETVTAGSSSLSYDAGTDQYNYVWKTDKNWAAGTCRQLVVRFTDGTTQYANFKFK